MAVVVTAAPVRASSAAGTGGPHRTQMTFWRVILLPVLSLLALLPLVPLPSRPAQIIGISRLPPRKHPGEPLLSRLFAKQLLQNLADGPAEYARVRAAHAQPALRGLNRSVVPLLALCPAPSCHSSDDLLVLTLLHKRGAGGPSHSPHRGVIEQWARPAAHYLRRPPPRSATTAIAHAARRGLGAAARQLAEQARVALHPQLLSDPDDWRLLWRQTLPGPAEGLAATADGRRLAVSYRKLAGEEITFHIRHFVAPRGDDAEDDASSGAADGDASYDPFDDDDDDDDVDDVGGVWRASGVSRTGGGHKAIGKGTDGGSEEGTPPAWPPAWAPMIKYEDLPLAGNLPISALALAGRSCVVYARVHDARLFRVLCRAPRSGPQVKALPPPRAARRFGKRGGASGVRARRRTSRQRRRASVAEGRVSEWRPLPWSGGRWKVMSPGPPVDRRAGHVETVVLSALPAAAAARRRHRPINDIGLLLVGQISPISGSANATKGGSGSGAAAGGTAGGGGRSEPGLALRLLSPPRRPPLSCRFGLQHVRRRRCLPRGQWMLRAGTAAQSAAGVREDETLTSSIEPSGESLAARTTRPLLAGSLDAAHTAVTFAHTITTVHTTHALPPARPRRGSRLQFWRLAGRRTLAGDGGASGDGSADGRASREAALLSALAQRHSAKPSSGAVSAVMLELQVGAPPPHLPFALILPSLSLSPDIPLLPSSFVCFHPPLTVAHGDSHASGGGCGRCPLPYPHSRAPRPTPRSPRRPSRGAPALPRRDPGTSG